MTPQPYDTSFRIPITFDYQGGRGAGTKGRIFISVVVIILSLLASISAWVNLDIGVILKGVVVIIILSLGLFLLRYLVFKEQWYSDIYEELALNNNELAIDDMWQIFQIDNVYPYTCYFRNGRKGIFLKLNKDVVTGKSDEHLYNHYQAIANAYQLAHRYNMDLIHIDYMDTVGNDPRIDAMEQDLNNADPILRDILAEMYNELHRNMSYNFASYDIYLFTTRNADIVTLQHQVNDIGLVMRTNSDYVSAEILDAPRISSVCTALFNLNDFSIAEACEKVLQTTESRCVVPIRREAADGKVLEVYNKTHEEELAEMQALQESAQLRKANSKLRKEKLKKAKKKAKGKLVEKPSTPVDIFAVDDSEADEKDADSSRDSLQKVDDAHSESPEKLDK